MISDADRLVDDYLRNLSRELGGVPRARRRELTDEIAGHIAEARANLDGENEAEVRNLLDRLGDPADIAAEYRERFGVRHRRIGVVEMIALVGLLVGGVLMPFIGWFVALVFLWVSQAWTTQEKLVGTLVVPGGLAPGLLLLAFGLYGEACSTLSQDGAIVSQTCTQGSDLLGIPGAIFVVALLLAPLVTTAFLVRRLRRPAPGPYQPSAGSA